MPLEDWLVAPGGPIRRERTTREAAFARWRDHRAAFAETGLWPILVPEDNLHILNENFEDSRGHDVAEDVATGLNLDVQAFFATNLEGQFEDEEYEMDLDFDPAELESESLPPVEGQVAALGEPRPGAVSDALWIALVPCREPWEVPAVLAYGNWNGCPAPAEHVAVLREWHARHGAEPLVVSGDTIELLVRPIRDPAEAKRVAIEQYAYCSDIVDQGVGTVRELAASLLGLSVWFFWWD